MMMSHNDLHVYETNQNESTFTENINSKKSNIIVGCFYKHPIIDVADFNYTLFLINWPKKTSFTSW